METTNGQDHRRGIRGQARDASEGNEGGHSPGGGAGQGRRAARPGRRRAATDAGKAKTAGMPSTTLDDNIGRMTSFVREMSKSKGKIKAGGWPLDPPPGRRGGATGRT